MYTTRGLLLLALASVASLQTIQAFSPAAPALRQGAVRRASCRGGVQALRAEREDGASEAQIKDAYETYEMLMGNKNFGKGYWMDEKPFFSNIAQAFQRNFGSEKDVVDVEDIPDMPSGSVNLKKSIFKPLVSMGDTEDMPDDKKTVVTMKVAAPIKAKEPTAEDDEDMKELQEKMAKAQKKKED